MLRSVEFGTLEQLNSNDVLDEWAATAAPRTGTTSRFDSLRVFVSCVHAGSDFAAMNSLAMTDQHRVKVCVFVIESQLQKASLLVGWTKNLTLVR
ncbi:MAG: hypothetical protein ACI9KE_004088 [Polyangiales bacterium]|jgi:hypothetical protein